MYGGIMKRLFTRFKKSSGQAAGALASLAGLLVMLGGSLIGCIGLDSSRAELEAHEGIGQGYRGLIHVLVYSAPGIPGIGDVEILEHQEDPFVGGAAIEELLELILETGSTDLDAVSGATESSTGFLTAVEEALAKFR
jgi:hypothetical protein